jgi:hypothetical protein
MRYMYKAGRRKRRGELTQPDPPAARGEEVRLQVLSDGHERQLTVTLAERPNLDRAIAGLPCFRFV